MTHISRLPPELIRMILQELYIMYSQEDDTGAAWSFSDAMKVHPIWQSIGNDIIYEEVSRIIGRQRQRQRHSSAGSPCSSARAGSATVDSHVIRSNNRIQKMYHIQHSRRAPANPNHDFRGHIARKQRNVY